MKDFSRCITLIGIGGVGSPVAQQIARLIPLSGIQRFVVYDFDTVEERNLEGQVLYTREDIGHLKVEALRHHLYNLPLGECRVEYHAQRVTQDTPLRGMVIVAVDNLATRKEVWEALDYRKGKNNIVPLLIEARVGEQYGMIYFLDPNDPEQMERYRKDVFWEEGEIPPDDRCVPADIGAVFGAVVAAMLKKFLKNWRPLKVKLGIIDFGEFPMVHLTDLE